MTVVVVVFEISFLSIKFSDVTAIGVSKDLYFSNEYAVAILLMLEKSIVKFSKMLKEMKVLFVNIFLIL